LEGVKEYKKENMWEKNRRQRGRDGVKKRRIKGRVKEKH
jgi:hypothetical protein